MQNRVLLSLVVTPLIFGMTGCGDEDELVDICSGKQLTPHITPVNFGELRPQGNSEPDLLDGTRTPFEWHLLLHSPCEDPVTIDEVCLVDAGDGAAQQFVLEGPEGPVASRGDDSVLRITYERQETHSGDDQDDIAIVIQSDADNAPTIVVPACARVTDDPADEPTMECNSPVAIPAEGESVGGLC